jgi:hypothetical protein
MWRRDIYKKQPPDLLLVFKADQHIRCYFYSLIVKVDALNKKYPGGLPAYMKKHRGVRCNRDLAVLCAMNMDDLAKAGIDITDHGLIGQKEAIVIDATSLAMYIGEYHKAKFGIPWLAGYYRKNVTMLRLAERGN